MSDDKRRPNPGTEPDLRALTPARLLSNAVGRGWSPERSASPSPQDASSSRQELDALRGREGQHGPAANLETRVVGSKPGVAPTEGLLAVGVQLQGRYKILGVIGVGGMGAVYRAQDLRFLGVTRLCAIKEMVNTATDPRVREMITRNFEREASILATLSHPAIPQVYDYFTEGSRSYLVLELSKARTLKRGSPRQRAARRRASGGVGYPVVRSVVVSAQSPAKADHLPRSRHRILCSMPMGVSASWTSASPRSSRAAKRAR